MRMTHIRWSACAAASGAAFLALTLAQQYLPGLVHVPDYALADAILPFHTLEAVQASLIITALGGAAGVIAIALGAAFFLRTHPHLLARLCFALIGSSLSVNLVKVLIARVRPETLLWLDPFLSYSFPSGHAAMSMALFGFLAVAIWRLVDERWAQVLGAALCISAILLVGASRITLAAHYLTDVLGGYLLGFFWVALVFSFPRR